MAGVLAVTGCGGASAMRAPTDRVEPVSDPSLASISDLVDVAGGSYVDGDADGSPDQPSRTVTIVPFRLMRTDVTRARFAAFVADPDLTAVISVPQRDAAAFCTHLGLRLATDVERQWASRGSDTASESHLDTAGFRCAASAPAPSALAPWPSSPSWPWSTPGRDWSASGSAIDGRPPTASARSGRR